MAEMSLFLAIPAGVFLIWLIALTVMWYRLTSHYNQLIKGVTDKNLKTVLEKILDNLSLNKDQITGLKKEIAAFQTENLVHFQKIGFVRFNPFPETGGNQSFCLALLDGKNNGFVLSSLHSRETTRIYAKPIRAGKPKDYDLSAEEKQAVLQAEKIKS